MGINFSSSNNYSERFPIDGSSVVVIGKTRIHKWRQVVETWSAEYNSVGRTTCELGLVKTINKYEEDVSISIKDHATEHASDNFDFQMIIRVKEGLLWGNSNISGPRNMQQVPNRKIIHAGVLKSSSFLYGTETDRKGLIVILRAKRNDNSEVLPYRITIKHYFVAASCSHGICVVAKIRSSEGGLSVEIEKPSKEPKHELLSMFDDVQRKGWCPNPTTSDCPLDLPNNNTLNANPGHQNMPLNAFGNGGYFKGSINNNPCFNNINIYGRW